MSLHDHIAGALLGVHCGDALGATVEFQSREEISRRYPRGIREIVGGGPFHWPAGHATDDTDLTRAVLLAYLEPTSDVVRSAADHMLSWWDGDWPDREPGSRPRDIGGATADGLARYRWTGDPRRAGAGPGRLGNGSLMRCIPTALAVRDRAQRIKESEAISAITHDDPRCTASCAVYNEIVAGLLSGMGPQAAVDAGARAAKRLGAVEVRQALDDARDLSLADAVAGGPTPLQDDGGGLVLDSLTLAVSAVLDPRTLPDVLVDVVRFGNDTDTNAAIAGGLLGARDGLSALPLTWVQKLQFRKEFLDGAAALVTFRQ